MTLRCLPPMPASILALVLAAGASVALAQTNAPAAAASKPAAKAPAKSNGNGTPGPAPRAAAASSPSLVVKPAASAPIQDKPKARPLSVEEKRHTMAAPGELQPERHVKPQVNIPLGRKPPDSTHPAARAPGSSLNDAAGRCAAIADENERAICRERAGLGGGSK